MSRWAKRLQDREAYSQALYDAAYRKVTVRLCPGGKERALNADLRSMVSACRR